MNFSMTNNQFYNSQYGFRLKHSCENAISELIGHVIKGHEKKEHTAAIFLDLSKAFDTLNHKLLLQKLELYGIRGTPLNGSIAILNNRYMRVKYQGDKKQDSPDGRQSHTEPHKEVVLEPCCFWSFATTYI